jgi:hypothetical protein
VQSIIDGHFFSLLGKTLAMIEKAKAFEFDAVLPLW